MQAAKSRGRHLILDGRGACIDKVFVEGLSKSVKCEQVNVQVCDSVSESRQSMLQYIDGYNRSGLHSRLGRATPDDAYAVTLLMAEAVGDPLWIGLQKTTHTVGLGTSIAERRDRQVKYGYTRVQEIVSGTAEY